ncbi:ATP-binding cassette domain-containing protein [Flagellimonas myxillae]|uniref:ATP-binding cassette domain-containing protein n=1 Tax=Flagellimonas myxillae TaxID=2942214 RepID=UPI00201ED703|nr:ATP-binding cassette domain-containing protein [Muricauda myxillae]MCL6265185.1 ATP-binding cassette domain-containing protein [Muricauda myxillae]
MVLEIDNIELNFGTKRILLGIYIKAEQGRVTGILGRNGTGKTSLFNILFGSLKPKYKSIRIDGSPITSKLFLSNRIAYLPQHQLLPFNMEISKVFRLFHVDWVKFTKEFEGFKIYKNSKVSMLSSGEVRVLETYLILHQNKDILLLDEPFSFIAPVYVERIKKLILEQKQDRIILVTDHFYRDIMDVSDTLYLFNAGASKLISGPEELVNSGYVNLNSQ